MIKHNIISTKNILNLTINITLLLTSNAPSNCTETCSKAKILPNSNLIHISNDIYLSKDGKLYQKTNCEIYITKKEINEYINLKSSLNLLKDSILFLSLEQMRINSKLRSYRAYKNFENHNNDMISLHLYDLTLNSHNNETEEQNRIKLRILSLRLEIHKIESKINTLELKIPNIKDISNNQLIKIRNERTRSSGKDNLTEPQEIEISPIFYKKFIPLKREPTAGELLKIKTIILEKIEILLKDKYKDKYQLIDNNNRRLRFLIKNMNREITNNRWEILEVNITPLLGGLKEIDIEISAVLYIKTGIGERIPDPDSYDIVEDKNNIKIYISNLSDYLKKNIPSTSITLREWLLFID